MSVLSAVFRTAVALCCVIVATPAAAATYTVTRLDDPLPGACLPTDCSLREAVIAANANPDADLVLLGAGVHELTQIGAGADELHGDLDITRPLTLRGAGSASTSIRMAAPTGGAAADLRVLSATYTQFAIEGITLREGRAVDLVFGAYGGCVYAMQVQLELADVRVTACEGTIGGGLSLHAVQGQFKEVQIDRNLAQHGAGLAISGSVLGGDGMRVEGNEATLAGGGISVRTIIGYHDSILTFGVGSRVGDNIANRGGGVHVLAGAHLAILPETPAAMAEGDLLRIEDNHARQSGGGIATDDPLGMWPSGTIEAERVALRRNVATIDGGGIFANGRLRLTDSELIDNVARNDGGGVATRSQAMFSRIERVSFSGNRASQDGGAVSAGVGSLAVINTTSHDNSAKRGGGFALEGYTDLMQVTSFRDAASQGPSVWYTAVVDVRNSVLAGGCQPTGVGAALALGGSSAYAIGVPACIGTAYDAASMKLKYAYFGGRFPVVGLGATSVLRNIASTSTYVDLRDVRDHARVLPTDVGGFDYDATP
jgi:CSLREA domain-containing protein